MKIQEIILENAERPYICVHAKKGKHECTASSSYEAAKKAAEKWGLKSTAGIDAYLADKEHTAINEAKGFTKEVDFDEYDQEEAFFRVFDPYRKHINTMKLKVTPEMVISNGRPLIKINVDGGSFSIYKYDKYIISVTDVGGEDTYLELINVPDTATLSKIIKKANKAADSADSSSDGGGFGYYGAHFEAKDFDDFDDDDEPVVDADSDKVKHIVMQLRSALDFDGDYAINFKDGTKAKLPVEDINLFLRKYESVKPADKETMQNVGGQNKEGFDKIVKFFKGQARPRSPYDNMAPSKSGGPTYYN